MSTSVDIKIRGRDYRVACQPEEIESLQVAASLLDARMAEIAGATKSTGERLAVMTALNLAHELNQARRTTPEGTAATENSIDAARTGRRIQAIEARLDALLTPPEG